MGPIKFIMAEIMRMRKILMLITSLRVKIQLTLEGKFIGQFLNGCSIGPIKKINRGKLRNYFAIVLSP